MKTLLGLMIAFLLVGCASATPQADALFMQELAFPNSAMIPDVPFIQQREGYCGPATLAMVLRWAGRDVSADSLASQVFTPGLKGSLQSDMISASRRIGMMALPIEGMSALLEEVHAGHPVIIFENLSVSWLPQWHYAVVIGYDLPNRKIIMHSGPEAFKQWDIQTFERSWILGNYWGLVVLPPEQLARTPSELAHSAAASALESIGQDQSAGKAYRRILQQWPKSLVARVGLANIEYKRKNYRDALELLRKASLEHPESKVVHHNLSVVEAEMRTLKEGL